MTKGWRLSLLIFAVSTAFAGPKIAPDLNPNSNAAIDVIVQFNHVLSADELRNLGAYGQLKQVFNSIRGASIKLPANVVQRLAADPSVVYISPDRKTRKSLDITTVAVGADLAWQYGWNGTGVGVAVIDSGINSEIGRAHV